MSNTGEEPFEKLACITCCCWGARNFCCAIEGVWTGITNGAPASTLSPRWSTQHRISQTHSYFLLFSVSRPALLASYSWNYILRVVLEIWDHFSAPQKSSTFINRRRSHLWDSVQADKDALINSNFQEKYLRPSKLCLLWVRSFDPSSIVRCFSCRDPQHLLKNYQKLLNVAEVAVRKLENSKKKRSFSGVNVARAAICQ